MLEAILLCLVASVTDGDTMRCQDGTRVRLAGIDAPEMSVCRNGRMCAQGDPNRSQRALSALTLGRTIRCQPNGRSYNRITAWCYAGRVDLSCRMVASGNAVRLPRYWRDHRC